jgi:hypothetical protein
MTFRRHAMPPRTTFSNYLARLVIWINEQPGYRCEIDEVMRPQVLQDIYIKTGKSKKKVSFHSSGCAGDVRIFKDGKYLENTEDYKFAGIYWESLDPFCVWGGRFGDNPATAKIEGWDGGHFQYGK